MQARKCSILNITLPSDNKPWDTIQFILDEIMYSKYISISAGIELLADYSEPIHTCLMVPNDVPSYADVPVHLPHFVPCSKNMINSSEAMPAGFQSYNCGTYLIAAALLCDGKDDCPSGEDEHHCSHVCTGTLCFSHCHFPECACHVFYYQCQQGGCIPFDKFCNNLRDCPLGEDEFGCESEVEAPYDSINITGSENIDMEKCTGSTGLVPCRSGTQCYHINDVCQYDINAQGQLLHYQDGTHLIGETACNYTVCRQSYKCLISYCIPLYKVCDGMVDCPNGVDEMSCDNIMRPDQVRCSRSKQCVIHEELCDGYAHCPEHDDELFCQHCPLSHCHCMGNMLQCHNATYIPVQQIKMIFSPRALVLHNGTSFLLDLTLHIPTRLNKVYSLNLHAGDAENVIESLQYFPALRWLSITRQRMYEIKHIPGLHLMNLDLSSNMIRSIVKGAFLQLNHLIILNLTLNRISVLKTHYFEHLKLLEALLLNNNPLFDVETAVFVKNSFLVYISSDWHMVCCTAIHVTQCHPQRSFVSSCSSLLPGVTFKAIIYVQAMTATVANSITLLYRLFCYNSKDKHTILIINLTVADLLMGLYLCLLTAADLSAYGNFSSMNIQWIKSYTCACASLLNFISSNLSLIMFVILALVQWQSITNICVLELKRYKVLCSAPWIIITVIGLSYVLYSSLTGQRLHNNMCIIMPFYYQEHASVLHVIFQRVILAVQLCCLFVILLLICTCLKVIYSHRNQMRRRNSPEQIFNMMRGTRVLVLLVCNTICWLPFLSIYLITQIGISLHKDVIEWLTILMLPICASTDPVLYNIGSIYNFVMCKDTIKTQKVK